MNNHSNISYQRHIFLFVGIFLVAFVFLANQWTVSVWLSYGGDLRLFDKIFLAVLDILCISTGVLFISKRSMLHVGKAELFLLTGTLLLLLAGSEIAARVLDASHGHDFLQNKQRAERSIIPFRMFGPDWYIMEDGVRYIEGRHGTRYPFIKKDGTFRIVAFGGSTTQNIVEGMHYPKRLQELLQESHPGRPIEVINVGNSAYATPHLLILLILDVLSWDPDLIIASENINDLTVAYFPDFTYDYANKYSHEMFLPNYSITQSLMGWSRLYWVARSRVEAFSYRLLEKQGRVYTRRVYGPMPPEENTTVFRRNLESFVDVAQARGIPIILASQPLEPSEEYWDKHMRFKKYNTVAVYPLHEEFILHHAAYNAIVKQTADKKGVYFLDNAAAFVGKRKLFSDFVHYTSDGIEELARQYALFIERHNFITP